MHDGIPHPPAPGADTPLGADPPRADTPPSGAGHPPGADTPQQQTPPQEQTPPQSRQPPPPEADSGIRSTNGRYASYWNAFLLHLPTSCGTNKESSNYIGIQCWQKWKYRLSCAFVKTLDWEISVYDNLMLVRQGTVSMTFQFCHQLCE